MNARAAAVGVWSAVRKTVVSHEVAGVAAAPVVMPRWAARHRACRGLGHGRCAAPARAPQSRVRNGAEANRGRQRAEPGAAPDTAM
ncbi:hypothetical protein C1280_01825 [Gemmata obscuriglobus]|uniref:Uncharacterized protein n=1 Tax=Gemmata obscuriglobus TaxID=114 RepID=A0A2Z3GWD1_9BACT|nr:hypothetical protein C1280_01825 [Gemmata obscuriglobus]